MQLHELRPAKGSTKRKKILGRGNGSGHGTYCCRGMNGQKSRSGYSRRAGFEGGRTPLCRQIPKLKGFRSIHIKPEIIGLDDLESRFKSGDVVDKRKLFKTGLIKSIKSRIKVLGNGELKKKLVVEVDQVSKSAKERIEKVGGIVKVVMVKKLKRRSNN